MNTVLKKAGIVLAAATAGVLALSPLAFAGDYDSGHDHHHHHHHSSDSGNDNDHSASCHQDNSSKDKAHGIHGQGGLVNVQDTTVQVPIQACNNSVIEGVLGILAKDQKNSDDHG
jgi:ABC-type Zn2+ transport system substrate-binding protein/surface adhesin